MVHAVAADRILAAHLEVTTVTPLLRIRSTTRDKSRVAHDYYETWANAPYVGMASRPPIELMLITRPRLRSSAGSSAWVTATWPNRLTSNTHRHWSIGRVSTGPLT